MESVLAAKGIDPEDQWSSPKSDPWNPCGPCSTSPPPSGVSSPQTDTDIDQDASEVSVFLSTIF